MSRIIKEKEQRLVGSESEQCGRVGGLLFQWASII